MQKYIYVIVNIAPGDNFGPSSASDITDTILPVSETTYLPPEPTDTACFTYTISNNEVTENVHARNQIITEVNELLRILPLKNWNRFIYLSYEKRILVM